MVKVLYFETFVGNGLKIYYLSGITEYTTSYKYVYVSL